MRQKIWKLAAYDEAQVQALARSANLPDVLARLYCRRGFCTPEAVAACQNDSDQALHDPFLLQDMQAACERVEAALEKGERIVVYGDYDVDGVTSTALLVSYLRSRGADCGYYIPERMGEGYGLNCAALDALLAAGAELIITVDCGISARSEVAYAREIGLDVLITDHHECGELLPEGVPLVNPKRRDSRYPYKELAGVAVAFKLVCALCGPSGFEAVCEDYLDLVAIGTIADVMPLLGENRLMVKRGLALIQKSPRVGVRALLSSAGSNPDKRVTAGLIGYTLAPRINAAGRMGAAGRAVELFLTQNQSEAALLADTLCSENRNRQEIENSMMQEALALLREQGFNAEKSRMIVLAREGWHHGVIGIVASRLGDIYRCPVLLLSLDAQWAKGSGRSVEGYNLFEGLERNARFLKKHGGHALAVGLTLERAQVDAFAEALLADAQAHIKGPPPDDVLEVDCVLPFSQLSVEMVQKTQQLEPYGAANPMPQFLLQNLNIKEALAISNDRHMRLNLQEQGEGITAFCFGTPPERFAFSPGDAVDVVCTLDINSYRGVERPQMVIKDLRLSKDQQAREDEAQAIYTAIKGGGALSPTQAAFALPDRGVFVSVFRYMKHHAVDNVFSANLGSLSRSIAWYARRELNHCQMMVCLDVFCELGLACLERKGSRMEVRFFEREDKVNLGESQILLKLKKMRQER